MSKLIYMIQVWGGCEKYLLQSLQTMQNKAARAVTRMERSTPTRIILRQCGWLSIHQLVVYHSTVLVHRVRLSGLPKYIYDMYNFHDEVYIQTRQACLKLLRLKRHKAPKSELACKGFRWRSCNEYNLLPLEIRSLEDINKFKRMAKLWIQDNIPLV